MATTKDFHGYIMEQLSPMGASCRPMMGEYCVYYNGKVVGGLYDNCFLIKETPSSRRLLPDAPLVYPYEGSKTPMLVVEDPENAVLISELLAVVAEELGKAGKSDSCKAKKV